MKKKTVFIIIFFFLACLVILISYLFLGDEKEKNEIKEAFNKKDEVIVEEEIVEPRRMSIVMVGDALIHGAVYLDAKQKDGSYDFSSMFKMIKPIIQDYDLRYYNQESIIGGGKPSHYPRLNSPKEIGQDLVSIGFNLISLANNHAFDKGENSIRYSNKFWKKQTGVITAGTYSSKEERDTIPVYIQNDIKFSFLSYTVRRNGLKASKGNEYLVNVYNKKQVKKDIERAKENGAEVIIVAMHWGNEYTHTPTKQQKNIESYLSSLGVNLIIGTHPHVIQPIDYVNDTLVIYSLGNFISAQKVLGLEKIIGLLVGVEIVVDEESNVTFENLDYQLLYTYYNSKNKNFKVYPFDRLKDSILKNHDKIEKEYLKIVETEV